MQGYTLFGHSEPIWVHGVLHAPGKQNPKPMFTASVDPERCNTFRSIHEPRRITLGLQRTFVHPSKTNRSIFALAEPSQAFTISRKYSKAICVSSIYYPGTEEIDYDSH